MLHSPLPLLLTAFSIIYSSHGQCSSNSPASTIFKFNDTTGQLDCSVSGLPNMICMDNNQIANGTHMVIGNNEGAYKCCCADCATDTDFCTSPQKLYAPLDSLLNETIQTTVEHVWGEPIKIQCPYVPGLLNMEYILQWKFSSPTIKVNRAEIFFNIDIPTNQLELKKFSSLFDGVFSCKLRSNDRPFTQYENVTVKTISNETNVVSITQAPAQTLVMINAKTSLQCTATVRSNESMGFRMIDPINNKVVKNMNTTNNQCTLQGDDKVFTNLSCIEDRYELLCDYSIPYEIKCDLQIENLKVNESSFVECFVFGEEMETVNSRTGLFVKPDLFPEPVITATDNGSNTFITFNLTLDYPLTFPVIIQIIINDQQQYNETAMMSNNNKQLQAIFTVTDITEMAAQYKIFSEDGSIMIIDSTFTLNIHVTPTASTSSMVSFSAATVPSPSTVEPSPTVVQNQNVLSKETISGIGGGIALLVLCILLVSIIITILMLNRTLNKKKMKCERPSEEEGNCPCPAETNELLTVSYTSHLSPRSDTYSQSQVSTIDTYIDEVSPRRHLPSQSSRSSHSHSSSSCPSTHNLRQKPLPRYGIPDHYSHYPNNPQYSLPLAGAPQITLIAPTPTMENQPVLGEFPDCLSPTGTEPFSPNEEKTESFGNPNKENTQNRPNDLPIGSPPQRNETGTTPLSDQTMIGVLLYLQHKDCDRRSNCKTCKLIDRHFERIANKYGDSTLTGIIKNLNTPGADGTLKHLRKREKRDKQRIRSPHKQQVAPLGVTMYKRQRSHSASHIDDEELTFSSTETDEDSLKPSTRRFKPLHNKFRKAVTDDERDVYDYNLLPLQKISEGISLSQHDIPTTPIDLASFSHLPGKSTVGKGSETDSTDGSMSSRCESNPRFDGSKGSGLSASYMKSPDVEQTLPAGFIYKSPAHKTTNSTITSGYETDSVFYHERTISSSSDSTTNERHPPSLKGPPSYSQINGLPVHQQSTNGQYTESNGQRSFPNYPYNDGRQVYSDDNCSLESASLSHKSQHHHQTSQSDYLKIAARQRSHENKSNLSLNNSGVLSMHSSPDHAQYYKRYTSNGSNGSNHSNHSNHSVHSESAALNYHPRTNHKHQFYSPPQQRRNKDVRTPSPFPLVLPSEDSSSTPI